MVFCIEGSVDGYKSIVVEDDSYQLQLSCYIHRNPYAGIVDKLEDESAVIVQEKFMFRPEMDDIINRIASVFGVSSESVLEF